MSHNATGYDEDMNPDMIDGIHSARNQWSGNNVKRALLAEAIVAGLDPGRIVYHHSSGNLGSMHTSNFYPNMAPIQELYDWFEHWATKGVKPMFTCEYMVPCHLGLDHVSRLVQGRARVRQRPGALGVLHRRVECAVPRRPGLPDQRGGEDEPPLGGRAVPTRQALASLGLSLSRSARRCSTFSTRSSAGTSPTTGGPSAPGASRPFRPGNTISSGGCATGADKGRKALKVDWEHLQRPGFSPDYFGEQYERMDLAYDRSDWMPTADGQAILRNNRPLLAYIGGKLPAFTSKDHNFYPGETVEKQLIVINNSRETVTAVYGWSLGLHEKFMASISKPVSIATGQQRAHSAAIRIAGNAGRGDL